VVFNDEDAEVPVQLMRSLGYEVLTWEIQREAADHGSTEDPSLGEKPHRGESPEQIVRGILSSRYRKERVTGAIAQGQIAGSQTKPHRGLQSGPPDSEFSVSRGHSIGKGISLNPPETRKNEGG